MTEGPRLSGPPALGVVVVRVAVDEHLQICGLPSATAAVSDAADSRAPQPLPPLFRT
jgi:hypothetical protein